MPVRGRCFILAYANLSGPVTVDEEGFVAAARNLVEEKAKRNETQGMWPVRACMSSFCNAKPPYCGWVTEKWDPRQSA